ncbi:unnamed protein product [Phaeothamnion confervicola]
MAQVAGDHMDVEVVVDVDAPSSSAAAASSGKGKGKVPASSADSLARQAALAASQGMPWVEKYRPATLDDLVAHEDIVSILTRLIDNQKLPHLLFYGPPGTGKTSTILACARRLYGSNFKFMVLELNASDDRGINVVREQIKEFAGTRNVFSSGVKLVILDEADAMTNDAQFALRRVIEKYTRHTRFCLICNYVNKIIPALQSRCTKFRFAPLKADQIRSRLTHVVDQEHVEITPDGTDAILRLGQGDMRRVLNLLQSTHMAYGKVTEEYAYLCAACPLTTDMDQIQKWLLNGTFKETYGKILDMTTSKGYALNDILQDLTLRLMNLAMPACILADLLDALSNVEYRMAFGCSDRLQLSALVGAFAAARYRMAAAAS